MSTSGTPQLVSLLTPNLFLFRVYMEAVKLETLHGSILAINNLQVAQDSYESNPNGEFLTGSEHLVGLVCLGFCVCVCVCVIYDLILFLKSVYDTLSFALICYINLGDRLS